MAVFFTIFIIVCIICYYIESVKREEQRQQEIKRRKEEQRLKEIQRQKEIQRKKLNFVKSKSKCIHAILKLNNNYHFKKFEVHPRYQRICNSKTQFDNFNIKNHMLLTIEDSQNYFLKLVKTVEYNRQNYKQYEKQYNDILNNRYNNCNYNLITKNSILEIDEFKSIELSECQKLKLNANTDFIIELFVCYTSPKGNNNYQKLFNLDYSKIQYYLNEFSKIEKNKQSAVYQRQLMTPKMRYKILKRDKFKCVICGRSEKDGAKLHVDHIQPVSKEGKTEESNLRTLCDLCNLGKSDEYDPYGLN